MEVELENINGSWTGVIIYKKVNPKKGEWILNRKTKLFGIFPFKYITTGSWNMKRKN